jgi:tetratricopeptide (TPR) repeat protein
LIQHQSYDSAIADAKVMRGNALSERGRIDESIREYNKAVRMYPESSWALNRLAQALRIAGDYDRASSLHQEALLIEDANANAIFGLGLIAYIQGHTEEAEACFRRALRCRDEYVNAMFGLARLMYCCGKQNDALEWLKKAEKKEPRSPRILLFTALVLAELGDRKGCSVALGSALNIFESRTRIGTPTGSHWLYYYSLALALGNSDNYKAKLTSALTVCSAPGLISEILTDVSRVTLSAISVFDSIELPPSARKNAAVRLTKFKEMCRIRAN